MADKKFAKGFYGKQPRQSAPSFVKGTISIKLDDAIEWLEANVNEKGYINLDILDGKEDKLTICLNEYKPKQTSDLPF
jgi:hypothetical protein